MNQNRFAAVTRLVSGVPSRRDLLRGLAGVGLGLGAARLPDRVEARKKGKPRIPKPNAFGCLNVGDACKRAGQCCSGICEGKKGKRSCKAHDTGTCSTGGQPGTCGGTDVACTSSLDEEGYCATTTGNAGYCMLYPFCYACETDGDCRAAEGGVLGPRAACIRCANCASFAGTACAIPGVP